MKSTATVYSNASSERQWRAADRSPGVGRTGRNQDEIGESGFDSCAVGGGCLGPINAGEQKPEVGLPINMTSVATFDLPWRLAFLPDGRMLITEKVGPVWLVSQQGEKIAVAGTPPGYCEGQNGMLGVFVSPHFASDQSVYLTYCEPGDYGCGLALARRLLSRPTANIYSSQWATASASPQPRIQISPKARSCA